MKKTLFFALAIVSTLTCIAPASAKISGNQNYLNNRHVSLIKNTPYGGDTQYYNRTVRPENKFDGMLASTPENQSTTSNNKQVIPAQPAKRGKPTDPPSIPAGGRYKANASQYNTYIFNAC